MDFQLGKVTIKLSVKSEILMMIFPVGDHVVSIHAELFRVGGNNAINISTDIYQKNDVLAAGKVKREMEEMGDA